MKNCYKGMGCFLCNILELLEIETEYVFIPHIGIRINYIQNKTVGDWKSLYQTILKVLKCC